jgi:predicted ArsR family transcriptional regulator
MIFSGLFGNETAANILLYLQELESGYPRAMAESLKLPVSQVQRQIERLEREGSLSSLVTDQIVAARTTRIRSFWDTSSRTNRDRAVAHNKLTLRPDP